MGSLSLRRRRSQIFIVLGLVAALFTAFSVSPAAAGTSHATAWSDACVEGTDLFSSIGRLGNAGHFARGTAHQPEAATNTMTEVPENRRRQGRGLRVTVPTWAHVVSDGAIGNVSDDAIRTQIQVLNTTFGGFEGGVATGFRFQLAGITRTNNAAWHYAGLNGPSHRDMKRALHRGGPETLNMYLTTAGPYLGWAYYPNIVDTGSFYLDGIVVDWESMLGTSTRYAGQYDQGETATHEAGHWLNLAHTFQGGCNRWGDHVEDTPPMLVPTNGCPAGKDTCPDPGLDPIHNYMDYSFDTCYTEFTAGQRDRMQDAWTEWRA
jgi:hypothetical protein